MTLLVCCLVTLFACILGTICGMGGGIIIKPVLDATGVMSGSTINFLSGCTVIAMSLWNVGKTTLKKESVLDMNATPFLAAGAAVGGLVGKQLYGMVKAMFPSGDMASGVQACLLLAATLATLLYTLKKDRITAKQIKSRIVCVVIGLVLGMLGSFLGIGGGPFNVAALCYFFSMPTKKAAQNSLLIVLFSQVVGTLKTIVTDGVPVLDLTILLAMVVIAVAASELGRRLNKKLDDRRATLCLEWSMVLIMGINVYNIFKYLV